MIYILIYSILATTSFASEKLHLGDIDIFKQKSEYNDSIELGFKFLHNFMYSQALYEFTKSLEIKEDPWAYIGLLASYHHSLWHFTNYEEANKVIPKAEKYAKEDTLSGKILMAYIKLYKSHDQNKFCDAIAKIYQEYPDNAEVAAIYGLSLMADKNDLKSSRIILNKALVRYPNHPGLLHYNIHAHDVQNLSIVRSAISTAEHYFKIAPNASHGLHMPSHIYVRLGMWDDSIISNQAAIKASDEICKYYNQDLFCDYENKLHAIEWVHYSYLQAGKDQESQKVLADLRQTMKHNNTKEINSIYTVMLSRSILYGLERNSEQIKPIVSKDNLGYWLIFREVSWLVSKAVTQSNIESIQKIINRLKTINDLCVNNEDKIKLYIDLSIMESEAALYYASGNTKQAIKTLIKAQAIEQKFMLHSIPSLGFLTASEYLAAIYKKTGEIEKYNELNEKIKTMFPNKREYKIFDQ